ncbi:hypothetical protein LXL04_007946 [Taraxacum kok-saghyz]
MIPVRNLAGSLNLSSVLGGIQWVNVRFNQGFSGTWIQSGLQWNLARMNQTEIDELLRKVGRPIPIYTIDSLRALKQRLTYIVPNVYD